MGDMEVEVQAWYIKYVSFVAGDVELCNICRETARLDDDDLLETTDIRFSLSSRRRRGNIGCFVSTLVHNKIFITK